MTGPLLVTGATGTVGAPLVDALVREGATVRAAARHPGPATEGGAEPVRFDFTDPSSYDAAFRDVQRMFLVRPPALARPERDLLPALTHAASLGLRHVVFLSVQGAERLRVVPHAAIERWVRRSGLSWTFLRPSFFDQNLLAVHGPAIREHGELVMPAGRSRTAFVDAHDVAQAAARVLLAPGRHQGRAYTLTGSEALTYAEVAATMSAVLGRPVRYTRPGLLSYLWQASRRLQLPAHLVAATAVVYTTARLGLAAGLSEDLGHLLGRPPTTMAEFLTREADVLGRVGSGGAEHRPSR